MDLFNQTFDDILMEESSNKSTVDQVCERLVQIEAEQSDFQLKQQNYRFAVQVNGRKFIVYWHLRIKYQQ